VPLDLPCVLQLPVELEMHDAIVVATTLLLQQMHSEEVVLVTGDSQIEQSGIVKTLW
jgi:hypothetical protein